MKTLITTLANTYKAMRLLSNPDVSAYLQKQLTQHTSPKGEGVAQLGIHSAFYHKHYIVEVVN